MAGGPAALRQLKLAARRVQELALVLASVRKHLATAHVASRKPIPAQMACAGRGKSPKMERAPQLPELRELLARQVQAAAEAFVRLVTTANRIMLTVPAPLKEPLAEEVAAFLGQLRRPEDRVLFGQLQTAIDQGEIPPELDEPLARLLRITLESGRFRQLYGPHAEAAARRLYLATEPGRQLQQQLEQVNQALALWQQQPLKSIRLSLRGPGTYTLELEGPAARTVLVLDAQGVRVQGVEAS